MVVVLIPLGALFTVLSAGWPAARRKLGHSPLTCAVALVFVPITTNAGHWLQNRIDPSHANQAIDHHANLAANYLFYAIGLFVISAAVWVLGRRFEFAPIATSSRSAHRYSPDGRRCRRRCRHSHSHPHPTASDAPCCPSGRLRSSSWRRS